MWLQKANAQKLESISPAHEADSALHVKCPLRKGNAHTTKPKTIPVQVPPVPCRTGAFNASINATEPAPEPEPRVLRPSAPKSDVSSGVNTNPNNGTTVERVPKNNRCTKHCPSPSASNDAVSFTSTATLNQHLSTPSKHAMNKALAWGFDHLAQADCGLGSEGDRQGGKLGPHRGPRGYFSRQRRCSAKERIVSKILPPVLPGVEVLEVSRCVVRNLGYVLTSQFPLVASRTQ